MSQFIAKSGGNTYHGKIYADYENQNIQSRNIDAAQIALGVKGGGGLGPTDLNRLHSYHDVNGDIGGFVKKDKLWWYSSLRDQDAQSLLPNFPVKPFETHLRNVTGKGTYAVSTNNKVVAFAQWGKKAAAEPARYVPREPDGRDSQQRGLDVEPVVLGAHLQARLGQRRQRQDVLRGARRPVPLPVAEHAQFAGAGLRGPQHEHRERRQPGRLVPRHHAQPGPRIAQLLQGRLGRAATT